MATIIKESTQIECKVKISIVMYRQMRTYLVKNRIVTSTDMSFFNVRCYDGEQAALKEFDKRVRELSQC